MRIRFSGNQVEVQTPAKVNFFLELHDRREDGFHQLETIISSVSLFDTLRLRLRHDNQIMIGLSPTCVQRADSPAHAVPTDKNNLVYRAIDLIRSQVRRGSNSEWELPGVDVWIDKRIPAAAGLGGASSNAAGAMMGVNHLWNCGFRLASLQQLGAQLGSDVPFFLTGGSAVCIGRGERVFPLKSPANMAVVIVKPPIGLSTRDVFGRCTIPRTPFSSRGISEQMSTGKARSVAKQLFNRLESVAAGMTDWIVRLKSSFSGLNCLGHQMTGSGSSYFGLFTNQMVALRAAACLSNRLPDAKIFACSTLGRVQSSSFLVRD